jgi:aryl carrier-like protein
MPTVADKVTMHKGTAADLERLSPQPSPDLVILNSVIQYFPSQTYLFDTIKALVLLPNVKSIFLGDVRSLALYDEFLAQRAFYVARGKATKSEFRRIMDDIKRAEAELLIDPAFFTQLQDQIDKIEHIEILPKKMRVTNELSTYRYEAVIHVNSGDQPCRRVCGVDEAQWIDFQKDGLSPSSLLALLQHGLKGSSIVAVSNIRHSKSSHMSQVVASLKHQTSDDNDDTRWLSICHEDSHTAPSMSAIDLSDLANQAGCRVELSWARQFSQGGALDAIFHRMEPVNGESRVLFRFPDNRRDRPDESLCSQPLQRRTRQEIHNELDQILKTQLPSYMIPKTIKILDKIPLNDNGKVDRRALEACAQTLVQGRETAQKAVSEAEGHIRKMWGEVLGIEEASIDPSDSFFQIGGDSITAMKLVGRARKSGLELTVRHLFQHPRLQDLVRAVG